MLSGTLDAEPQGPSTSRNRCRRRASTVYTLLIVAFLTVGLASNRGLLHQAVHHLRGISALAAVTLGLVVVCHRLSLAALAAASVDGLALPRAWLCAEAYLGCSNAMVGGAGVGTGLKVAMMRSWAVPPARIAAGVVATAVAPALAMWSLAAAESIPAAFEPAERVQRIVLIAASVALIGQLGFWAMVVGRDGPSRRLGRNLARLAGWASSAHRPLGTKALLPARWRRQLGQADPAALIEHLRRATAQLSRRRGPQLLASAIAGQLLLALLLVVSLRAVGSAGRGASTFEVMQAFATVRVAASFVPLPGSIGVLDVGLVSALTQAGAQRPAALAAVLLFRAVTFLLPMATGLAAALVWRRSPAARATTGLSERVALAGGPLRGEAFPGEAHLPGAERGEGRPAPLSLIPAAAVVLSSEAR